MTYEWSINGTVYATSESITVPASAKSGDRIKVKVTDADGETAEDTVYVGGFTIVNVEPTTAMGTNGAGYKYIQAEFSTALSDLSVDSVEIRAKKDKQLYSVESVDLSSDGTTAKITLFGSLDDGGTTFLQAGEIYILKIANENGEDSFEFQLPDNRSNLTVVSVDVEKNKIKAVSNGTSDPSTGGTFNVGDIFEDNLGQLVGRTVSVGVDSSNALMNLYVNDEDVVYAQVTYNYGKDKSYYTSDDYFETADGTKYYFEATPTKSIAATRCYDASTGEREYPTQDDDGDTDVYKYAKLVLNPNGTIAAAMLEGNVDWNGHIMTTSIDGTRVVESSALALDFKDYLIVKDGDYIDIDDLEAGDVLYYNSVSKFVDVYAEEVEGQLSNLTDEKISVDGTAYKWGGAQYLKDDKYATLTAKNLDSMKYLNSLDQDLDTTVLLNRAGNIAYIFGTVTDNSTTSDTVYALTAPASVYKIGTHGFLELPVSDGESSTTLRVDTADLTKWNGLSVTSVAPDATNATYLDVDYEKAAAVDGGASDLVDLKVGTDMMKAKELIVVTRDKDDNIIGITAINVSATGDVIGSKDAVAIHSFAATDKVLNGDAANSWKLSKSTTIIPEVTSSDNSIAGANAKNYQVTTSTPVYILSTSSGKVVAKKTTVGELTTVAKNNFVKGYVEPGKTKIKWIVVDNTAGTAWAEGDTDAIGGVIKDFTVGLNETTKEKEVESVTLLTVDGEIVIDGDEVGKTTTNAAAPNAVTEIAKGQYRVFNVEKGTYTLSSITDTDRFTTKSLAVGRSYSDSKFTFTDNSTMVLDSEYKVYEYAPASNKYTETTIGAINTDKTHAYSVKFYATTNDGATPKNYTANIVVATKLVVPTFEVTSPAEPIDISALAAGATQTVVITSDVEIDTATATVTGTNATTVSNATVADVGLSKTITITLTKGSQEYNAENVNLTLNYLAGPNYSAGTFTFNVITEVDVAVPTDVTITGATSTATETTFTIAIKDQNGNDISASTSTANLTVTTAGDAYSTTAGSTVNNAKLVTIKNSADVTGTNCSSAPTVVTIELTANNVTKTATFNIAHTASSAATNVTVTLA